MTRRVSLVPLYQEPRRLVRTALLFYGALAALAWLWRTGIRGESLWLADAAVAIDWRRDPLLGAVTAAGVIAVSALLGRWTEMGRRLEETFSELLGPLRWRECLVLGAASGFAEEALFRGALQPEVGLVIASLLFAAAHFAPRRDLRVWTVFAFGAGLLLGALYDATGNLVAPVVAHAGINAVNLRLLSRRYGAETAPPRA